MGQPIQNWITTTIKQKYLDEILSGKKIAESKVAKPFWKKRLHKYRGEHDGNLGINFVCGQDNFKFYVTEIVHKELPLDRCIDIDGEQTRKYYLIYLGDRIKEEVEINE